MSCVFVSKGVSIYRSAIESTHSLNRNENCCDKRRIVDFL